MIEKTLVLIKPDGVERNLIGDILSIYEKHNLKIINIKLTKASKKMAIEHYIEHIEKPFFNEIVTYLTRNPLVAVILEGDDAINVVRTLNGRTNPLLAEKGTIRKEFVLDSAPNENLVHASDSPVSAEREIYLWFQD